MAVNGVATATRKRISLPVSTYQPAPYTGPSREEVLALRRQYLTPGLITYYQESGSDAGRVPMTYHDFVLTTDTSDVTAQVNAAGFFRAA